MKHEQITLGRRCAGVRIPSGESIELAAGTVVKLQQSLGGTFTVTTDQGHLVRISGADADALGLTAPPEGAESGADKSVPDLVWEQLRTCFDPEIPVNIVELGLVYRCDVEALNDGGHRADIAITLTAPGCGMGPVLKADVERKLAALPGIREVNIELVWEPAWTPEKMSDAARLQLGMV